MRKPSIASLHIGKIVPPLPSAVVLVSLLLSPAVPSAQEPAHHPAGSPDEVGRVTFATTCSEAVQADFERAVAMLHSFWFAESARAFQQVAAADPACAMAQWGIAMTEMGNPMARVLPPPEALRTGLAASERAVQLAASQSHREQMYAETVLAFYRGEGRSLRDRMTAHEEALANLQRTHPEDPEGAIV